MWLTALKKIKKSLPLKEKKFLGIKKKKKSKMWLSDGHFEESTLCQQHQGGDHVSAVGNLQRKENTIPRLLGKENATMIFNDF